MMRRYTFRLGLAVLPIVILLLIEAGVRLAGFSKGYPLFVAVPGNDGFLVANPKIGHRYFSSSNPPPNILADYFRSEKTDSTLRIVVQGGSTAAGFPFYYGGTFPNILETRLQASVPDMQVEVVNVSMAAVNSFTLLDLVGEIISIEPDAVLFYAGHNEYYGALGVGSTEHVPGGSSLVRLYLALQRFRTVQLLKAGLAELSETESATDGRMAQLARSRFIPFESRAYQAGVDQFRGNFSRLLRRYERAGIPAYVSTIACNLRDQAPFASLDSSETTSAAAHFRAGQRLLEKGRFGDALHAFTKAKEYDGLRFRAPEAMNTVIRRLAGTHGARLVDGGGALADSAKYGIVGYELMTDHLHPTARGYSLIADAFYEALYRDGFVPQYTSYNKADILLTRVDSLVGAFHIADLRSRWPFKDSSADAVGAVQTSDHAVEQLARALYEGRISWNEANARLIAFHQSTGNTALALRAARSRMQELPHRLEAYVPAARIHAVHGRYSEAARVLLDGLAADEQAEGHVLLSEVYRAMGDVDRMRRHRVRAQELSAASSDDIRR